jgi:hypothetical protein
LRVADDNPTGGAEMGIVEILVIILLIVLIAGFFGRGRFRRL